MIQRMIDQNKEKKKDNKYFDRVKEVKKIEKKEMKKLKRKNIDYFA